MSILDKVLEGEEPGREWKPIGRTFIPETRFERIPIPQAKFNAPDGKEYKNVNDYLNPLLGFKVKALYRNADYWVAGTLAKTYKGEWYIQGSYKGTRIKEETVEKVD